MDETLFKTLLHPIFTEIDRFRALCSIPSFLISVYFNPIIASQLRRNRLLERVIKTIKMNRKVKRRLQYGR